MCPLFRAPGSTYSGLWPSCAAYLAGSTFTADLPNPSATFRSQAFSTSQRFAPQASFTGLFHPVNHVQGSFTPSRGFSPRAAFLPHRKALPPCRCRGSTSRPKPGAMLPRLDFEALVHAKQRSLRFGVSLPVSRSPQRVSVSSRYSLSPPLAPVTGCHPLLTFHRAGSALARWPNPAVFSVLPTRSSACLSPNCRPARDFRALNLR